jgi:CheY-like chemotaxis protein
MSMTAHASSNILVVDDDKVMGELLVALLTMKGHGVTHVHSGTEALERVRQLEPKPGIVLCDIHMPGLGGSELAMALIATRKSGVLPAETLLLGMSGSAPDREESELFDYFLQKPFTLEDFADAVERTRAQRGPGATGAEDGRDASGEVSPRTVGKGRANGSSPPPLTLPPLEERTFAQLRSKLTDDQLRQLYAMTLTDVQMRLEQMAAAAKSGDVAGVRHEAHAIKGGCGMVGAFELQELAAATEGGSAVDTSSLADFAAACQRLQRMLDERL